MPFNGYEWQFDGVLSTTVINAILMLIKCLFDSYQCHIMVLNDILMAIPAFLMVINAILIVYQYRFDRD